MNNLERWFGNRSGREAPKPPETPQERFDRLMAMNDPDLSDSLRSLKNIKDYLDAGDTVRGAQGDAVNADLLLRNVNRRLQQRGEKPVTLDDIP